MYNKKVLFVGNKQLYILKCNGQRSLLALFLLIQKYFSTITCYNDNVIKTPWRFYIEQFSIRRNYYEKETDFSFSDRCHDYRNGSQDAVQETAMLMRETTLLLTTLL